MPKTTEGPSYCDPVGSANLGRNHLFPFRSRCLKRNITDIPLHKVAWRIQPRNPRVDQHWQRLRCNASANLICTFVMPAIRLIDTRHGSRNGRYVKSFVQGFRCGITAASSFCHKLQMLSAPMNRVPASKWDKRRGTILHTSAELLSGREWLKTGRPK